MSDTENKTEVVSEETAEQKAARQGRRKAIFIVCLVIAVLIFVAHYVLVGSCAPGDEAFTAHDYVIKKLLPQLGNSCLVFSLLWYFGWPMLEKMVSDRKQQIERDIDESTRLKAAAEASMAEMSEKLGNLTAEKDRMVARYAETTQAESVRIKEEAEQTAARLAHDAEVAFELQANHTRHTFELEVVNKAVEKARTEIIHRLEHDSGLRDKLIDDSIASLEL